MSGHDFDGARILIIDDSSTIRYAAAAILGRAGCRVATAPDGYTALAEIVEHRPDLILVDNQMPRLDGYQTCAVIRRNRNFQRTPLVLLINLERQHLDKVRGAMLGIDDYLAKPFTAQELTSCVRRHLPG